MSSCFHISVSHPYQETIMLIVTLFLHENLLTMLQLNILQVLLLILVLDKGEIDAIEDCAKAVTNYIYGDNKTPFISFFSALMQDRINPFKKYSWVGWFYVAYYVLSIIYVVNRLRGLL